MPKIAEEARTARRDQIIAAAADCFARGGYHVTTMADIAEAAGVSKGTPYLYFPGKEALFIALYEEWDCGLAARVDAAVASAVAAHVTGNPQACRVLMEATTLAAYEPAIAARVQAANAASLDQLTGLFTAGSAAGQWPDADPALQARLFTAGLYGLMAQWHTAPGSFCLQDAMQALAEKTWSGDVGAGKETEGAGP